MHILQNLDTFRMKVNENYPTDPAKVKHPKYCTTTYAFTYKCNDRNYGELALT